ncbi:putative Flp/Fap pilin component [Candidatus Sulfopaludibacter sp. SbA3]|nr:putative Flp/Fap pilin component [Candidatus Sulfopaludibacter sp. SbA3]
MVQYVHDLWCDEHGQDLVEYSLLIALIAISCAIFIGAGRPAVNGIWASANSQIVTANGAAAGS